MTQKLSGVSRRTVVSTIGATGIATALRPLSALAQAQARRPVIGRLSGGAPGVTADITRAAWLQALRELGHPDVVLETRYADGQTARLPALAAELVRLQPDVILASDVTTAVALNAATTTIPIVLSASNAPADPVAAGLVASTARPGGNITGWILAPVTRPAVFDQYELIRAWLPSATRIAQAVNPLAADVAATWQNAMNAAKAVGLPQPTRIEVKAIGELNAAFQSMTTQRIEFAVLALANVLAADLKLPATLAVSTRIPVLYGNRLVAEENGGLASIHAAEVPVIDDVRRSAQYVDKILKGGKPADLAMQVAPPLRRETLINRKAAQAIGLAIPASLAAKARVIEG